MREQAMIVGLVLGIGLLLITQTVFWPRQPRSSSEVSAGLRIGERLRLLVESAGFPNLKLWMLPIICVGSGVLATVVAVMFLPIQGVLLVAFLGGLALPVAVLFARARKRVETARVVWPDLLDQLIASLRSGLSLAEGLQALAGGSSRAATAFREFSEYYERSHSFDRALERLKSSLGDPIADRVLEGIRMVREVGGNELIPMLQQLGESLRKENRLRQELVARQSWLMNAARLGAVAPWLVLVIIGSRPETAQVYNTAIGTMIILFGLVLTLIAYFVMTRIARLPAEARWLS